MRILVSWLRDFVAIDVSIDELAAVLTMRGFEVSAIDLAPATVQGRSLCPLLEGRSPDDWRQSTYYAYYENSWALHGRSDEAMAEPYRYFTPHRIGPHRGVRTDRYKLIEYYGEGEYWEFFDLWEDPEELHNLYGDAEYAAQTAALKEDLGNRRREYGDLT